MLHDERRWFSNSSATKSKSQTLSTLKVKRYADAIKMTRREVAETSEEQLPTGHHTNGPGLHVAEQDGLIFTIC
jgi:hypothetical protein